jgi:endonuclease/exonuclease/phosphatase family metal-dependent hydrolase
MPVMRNAGIALAVAALAAAWPGAASAAPRTITVMTFNIASAVETGNELDPFASLIDDQGAQVVGLQEVDRSWSRSDSLDQAKEVALRTGMGYAFDPNVDCADRDLDKDGVCDYGTAILSRFPMRASATRRYRLPRPEWDENRGLAAVGVIVGGRRVTVFNTHLSPHLYSRQTQMNAIVRILRATRPPYILMGDLNATPSAPEIVRLRRLGLTEAGVATRLRRPTVGNKRVDYVFVSRGVQVLSTRVPASGDPPISDHRPLVARLRVN